MATEFETAIKYNKPMMIIKLHGYTVPQQLPSQWQPYKGHFYDSNIKLYRSEYLPELKEMILKKVAKLPK